MFVTQGEPRVSKAKMICKWPTLQNGQGLILATFIGLGAGGFLQSFCCNFDDFFGILQAKLNLRPFAIDGLDRWRIAFPKHFSLIL